VIDNEILLRSDTERKEVNEGMSDFFGTVTAFPDSDEYSRSRCVSEQTLIDALCLLTRVS
jgi:hypothetical protein